MSEDKDAEIARLRAANENNLAGWSNDRVGLSGKIARLEAEVAALRKERDEARSRILSAEMDRDVAYAKLEGTWPHQQIDKLTRDWEAMNKAADRFCADWKRAESRLSALAAAARRYQRAEDRYGHVTARLDRPVDRTECEMAATELREAAAVLRNILDRLDGKDGGK